MTAAEQIAGALGARRSGNGWRARCPGHGGGDFNLSISEGGGGKVLLKCWSRGCDYAAIVAGIEQQFGIRLGGGDGSDGGAPEATYQYTDEAGVLLYEVLRFRKPDGGKKVSQRRPSIGGGWTYSLGGVRRVLYHLPEVVGATQVIVTEGEKCADRLRDAIRATLPEDKWHTLAVTTSPGGAGKWTDDYSPFLTGRDVVILPDADEPGRKHAQQVATSAQRFAYRLKVVELPGLPPAGDIADWLEGGHTVAELRALISAAPLWSAPATEAAPATVWAEAAPVPAEEDGTDAPEEIEPGLLYRESIARLSSPRGLGKTEFAVALAVRLAKAGRRVLILDRDNPPRASRARIRNWGGAELPTLKHLPRNKIPPLTDAAEWSTFPLGAYDAILVDSFESFTEGCGEQDSTKPSLALAALLDVVRTENGPAILLLSNTTKDGKRGRGSGVTEDRLDFIFEVRDATGFRPTGKVPWWEELPPAGADDWASRATRRKAQAGFRLAFICTKFRGDSEPEPRAYEVDFSGPARTCRDVTADLDAAGEGEREARRQAKADAHFRAVEALQAEVMRRGRAGEPPIRKRDAEELLRDRGLTRKDSMAVIESPTFMLEPAEGPGRQPKAIRLTQAPCISAVDGHIQRSAKPAQTKDETHAEYARPRPEQPGIFNGDDSRNPRRSSEAVNMPEDSEDTSPMGQQLAATAQPHADPAAAARAIAFARAQKQREAKVEVEL